MSQGEITTELIAGEIKRGDSALGRARLTFHDGVPTVDLRVWVRRPNGTLRPTGSGITLPRSKTPELCRLVRALGLSERENRPPPGKAGGGKEKTARKSP